MSFKPEVNGVKGEINLKFDVDSTKHKSKKVIKKIEGDYQDNSSNQAAKTIVNNSIIVCASPQEVQALLGNSAQSFSNQIIDEMTKVPKNKIENGLKTINPYTLAANASTENAGEQVEALIDDTISESIKRNAIQKFAVISKQDLKLLKVINSIRNINKVLQSYWVPTTKIDMDSIYKILRIAINQAQNVLITYISEYGNLKFETFQNLKNHGIIINDGNTYVPYTEMILKSFYALCEDKTRNDEYLNAPAEEKATRTRSSWKSWFSKDKFKDPKVLEILKDMTSLIKALPAHDYWTPEDDEGKMYYSITQLGYVMLSIANKHDKRKES